MPSGLPWSGTKLKSGPSAAQRPQGAPRKPWHPWKEIRVWGVNVRGRGKVNPPIPSIGQGPADPPAPFGGHLGTAALRANQEQGFKFCFCLACVDHVWSG